MLTIRTNPCRVCGLASFLTFQREELEALDNWRNGMTIQNAFPNWDQNKRELLKTGIHPECWDKLFKDAD